MNGIVESFDASRCEGVIWTADREKPVTFFSTEPWIKGTLVVFDEIVIATNVRKNTAVSPISSVYDVRSDAAMNPGYETLNGKLPFSENADAFTQYGDREVAEAQSEKIVPVLDCGTFDSSDDAKSHGFRPWND